MERENAVLGICMTLEEPSKPMIAEAKAAGQYKHEERLPGAMIELVVGLTHYHRIEIVTVCDIIENGKRLVIPMSLEVLSRFPETG